MSEGKTMRNYIGWCWSTDNSIEGKSQKFQFLGLIAIAERIQLYFDGDVGGAGYERCRLWCI